MITYRVCFDRLRGKTDTICRDDQVSGDSKAVERVYTDIECRKAAICYLFCEI